MDWGSGVTDSANRPAFGEHFAKPGELDAKFHRYVLEAFESRLQADYGVGIVLRREAVDEMIHWAEDFLAAARLYVHERAGDEKRDSGEPGGPKAVR